MAEWSKAVDSKSIVRSCVPGVRIPLSPPFLFNLRLLVQEEKFLLETFYFKGAIKVLHAPDYELIRSSARGRMVGVIVFQGIERCGYCSGFGNQTAFWK